MKYTTSKEADEKIEEDLEIIKKIIISKFNPIAIVMFGGFGHCSGSFRKINKKILPLNDYDMYIITNKKISNKILEDLGVECSRAIGRGGKEFVEDFGKDYNENEFFHVDLHNMTINALKKPYPTQRSFDLKTSLVIYGESSILDNIPNIKISKSDAIRLLFNKLNHFLLARNNSNIIKEIYATKGLTDLCSALLIFSGKYDSRYSERAKIFSKLNFPEELKRLVNEATDAKLNCGYRFDEEDGFKKSEEWVRWALKKIIKEHLRINDNDWKIIIEKMYRTLPFVYFNDYTNSKFLFPAQYYLNIRFFLEALRKKEFLIKSLLNWRDAGIIIALSLVLYSIGDEKEAEKYLKKLTNKTKPLKERILKLYSIYYLQKLI